MNSLRRRGIGPTFLIALVLSALLLWWQHVQRTGPAVIEHQTAAVTGLPGVPAPDFVQAHAADLGLSTAQKTRVAALAADWQRQTGDLQRQLDAASTALRGKLSATPPAQYGVEAAQVQSLSRDLSTARQAAWPKLEQILDADQQRRAREAWVQAHSLIPRKPPPPGA
jgi:hypothetical protein